MLSLSDFLRFLGGGSFFSMVPSVAKILHRANNKSEATCPIYRSEKNEVFHSEKFVF